MKVTKELLEALAHVRSVFPEVTMVILNQFGQWNYCDSNFGSPIFDDRIDDSLLEDGADSILELPFVYELPLEEIEIEVCI